MIELVDRVAVQNELGEGVIWDQLRQRIYWTDIANSILYRYDPGTATLESWPTPERLCCFAPVHQQRYLVAAFASGFAYYLPQTGEVEWIQKIESDNPGTRLNDGRTDRQGRMWAGTMVEERQLASYKGSLYCLHTDHRISIALRDLSITNSLCWSPDSKYLYHCDTPKRRINRYRFDPQEAQLSDASIFVETGEACFPDGSIVDADGFLWNAQWGAGQVVRYAPDGAIDTIVKVPASQPTCVAFAGANLDLLVVTTAHQDLTSSARLAEPYAGDLFIYQTNHRGLPESRFKPSPDYLATIF